MKGVVLITLLYLYHNVGTATKNINTGDKPYNFEGRVIEGVEVPISMYPFVAQLTYRSYPFCGGSIISDRVILTVAHCLTFDNKILNPKHYSVYLGSALSKDGAKYRVCKLLPHENYNSSSYLYDIGLMLTAVKIRTNKLVEKIQIAPTYKWRKQKYQFTVAGFGLDVSFEGGVSERLKATRMQYVDSETCNNSKTDDGLVMPVPKHMFCLISWKWTSDCNGDSGSGIIWNRYLVGLVSLGRSTYCASDMMPSMYTDVVYFRKWIKKHVKELESLSIGKCKEKVHHYRTNPLEKHINSKKVKI